MRQIEAQLDNADEMVSDIPYTLLPFFFNLSLFFLQIQSMTLELKTADEGTKAEFGSQVQNFKRTVANLRSDFATLQRQQNKDNLFDSVFALSLSSFFPWCLLEREKAVKTDGGCRTRPAGYRTRTRSFEEPSERSRRRKTTAWVRLLLLFSFHLFFISFFLSLGFPVISDELQRNREVIEDNRARVNQFRGLTSDAGSLITEMGRRETQQKMIMWVVGIVIGLALYALFHMFCSWHYHRSGRAHHHHLLRLKGLEGRKGGGRRTQEGDRKN